VPNIPNCGYHQWYAFSVCQLYAFYFNPYPANVENMVSS